MDQEKRVETIVVVNIINNHSALSLSNDHKILAGVLRRNGITVNDSPQYNAYINIFLENIDSRYFGFAKNNLLIPNPEWFIPSHVHKLKDINLILCKTRDSENIFKKYGKCVFTSWTSEDKLLSHVNRFESFCHFAGSSNSKNTHVVNNVWDFYDDLPLLCISKYGGLVLSLIPTKNKVVFKSPIDTFQHTELLNECRYHLCPSEYEGFGLYIWEGLSTGNIIFVSDHPPMNSFGIDKRCYIPVSSTKPSNMASVCSIIPIDLFETVRNVLVLPEEEKILIGRRNRNIWESNDLFFQEKVVDIIKGL